MQNKRGNTSTFVIIFLLITMIALALIIIYLVAPSFMPEFKQQAEETVKRAATGIEELTRNEGEQIQELSPGELPSNVLPERSLYLLEKETFDEMNKARTRRGISELIWYELLANVAFKHSQNQAENEYLNHTDMEGLSPGDRIANARIFNICNSENIFFIDSTNSKRGLAEKAVEGWLDSPGHRKNLLAEDITRAGVGISCKINKCYVTTNHICTKNQIVQQMQTGFIYFLTIYPEDVPTNLPVQIEFHLTATQPIDIYLVPDSEQYQKYIKRQSFLYTKKYNNVEETIDTAVIKKGYGFLVIPSKDSGLNIEVEYL